METIFKKGEELWTIRNHKVVSGKVYKIQIEIEEECTITYFLNDTENGVICENEENLYLSKEDLIKNL